MNVQVTSIRNLLTAVFDWLMTALVVCVMYDELIRIPLIARVYIVASCAVFIAMLLMLKKAVQTVFGKASPAMVVTFKPNTPGLLVLTLKKLEPDESPGTSTN